MNKIKIKQSLINNPTDRIKAADVLLKLMKILGLWHWRDDKEHHRFRLVEYFQKFSIHIPFSFLYVFLMWAEVFQSTGLDEAGDILYMSFTEIALIVKIINIWYYSDRAWNFINELSHNKMYELINNEEFTIWQRKQKQFRLIILIYLSGSILTIVAAAVGVLLADDYQLPFAYWVPFDWRSNVRNYWIAYVYNIFGISVTGCTNVCLDMMGCYLMFHISLLYKILGLRLTQLKAVLRDDVVKELRKIFELHKNVKRLNKECETIVSSYVLSQIILSAFILCFCGYRIQKMNILQNLGQFFSMQQFLCVMILEIYLPCFFANEITLNSSQLSNQIYSSDWLQFSIPTRKLMILYMEFLKQPEKIKAANYFDVGLPIFTKVINNAYTVFALLMNVEK